MNAQERAAKIAEHTAARLRGEHAAAQKQMLEELFVARQRSYVKQLVSMTRLTGQVAENEAWKLVALDDLMSDFDRIVKKGRSAARSIEKLQKEAEVDN